MALEPISSATVPPSVSVVREGIGIILFLKLFQEMKHNGIEPNIISYYATSSACEKGGQWEKALNLFQEMKYNGINKLQFHHQCL